MYCCHDDGSGWKCLYELHIKATKLVTMETCVNIQRQSYALLTVINCLRLFVALFMCTMLIVVVGDMFVQSIVAMCTIIRYSNSELLPEAIS